MCRCQTAPSSRPGDDVTLARHTHHPTPQAEQVTSPDLLSLSIHFLFPFVIPFFPPSIFPSLHHASSIPSIHSSPISSIPPFLNSRGASPYSPSVFISIYTSLRFHLYIFLSHTLTPSLPHCDSCSLCQSLATSGFRRRQTAD